MRKILYILPLLLITVFTHAQQTITVKMDSYDPEQTVLLAHYYGYKQFIKVDSSNFDNGVLTFKSNDDQWKGGLYLVVMDQSKYFDFVVSGDEGDIYMEFDPEDYINTVTFKNSNENDAFFEYRRFLEKESKKAGAIQVQLQSESDPAKVNELRNELTGIQKEINQGVKKYAGQYSHLFASSLIKANLEPELPSEPPLLPNGRPDSTYMFRAYKAQFWNNINLGDERMIRTPFIESKVEQYFNNLVFQRSDSLIKDSDLVLNKALEDNDVYRYLLWYITNKYENTDIVGLDGLVIHLYENHYLKNGDWLDEGQRQRFEERLATIKPLETGKVMPPLILKDPQGNNHDLYDVKAKYTIVYFYSPTCGHCKDSAPAVVKYHNENKDKGIAFWNVSTDQDEGSAEMRKFIKEFGMEDVINLHDPDHNYNFYYRYDVYATPTLFILDEDKRIIAKRIPVEELSNYIEHYEKNVKGK